MMWPLMPHHPVFGNIHGNEPCGLIALEMLRSELERGDLVLQLGRLTLVPCCNRAAADLNKDWTEENLNRIFYPHQHPETSEHHLANFLCPLVAEADALLDLHSTTAPTSPFLFLDYETAGNVAWAKALGMGHALLGWPDLHSGAGGGVCTQDYAHSLGKPALTVECGQHSEAEAPRNALKVIHASLRHFGLLEAGSVAGGKSVFIRMTQMYLRGEGDQFAGNLANFSPVKQGERIVVRESRPDILAPADGCLIMPKATAQQGEDWLYFGVAA